MSNYRIKTVSKITNIPVDTIRNWEKRYSFLKPQSGPTGEKLYSDQDVDLLRRITSLLKSGGRISEIASRILDGDSLSDAGSENSEKISNEVQLMIEEYYQHLLSADLNRIDQVESILEITVAFRNRVNFIYYPLLERTRQDNAKGIITHAQEHFTNGHLLNKMKGFLTGNVFNGDSKKCSIICSTPSKSVFEGGSLVLACGMKLKGHNIFYLGPDLPISELKGFAERVQPAVVAVSIYHPDELRRVIEVFEKSPFPVCVGGLGVRLAEVTEANAGSVHFITQTGSLATEKLESISLEYFEEFKKRNAANSISS